MSTFTAAQLAYLTERRLARIATVGAPTAPHTSPRSACGRITPSTTASTSPDATSRAARSSATWPAPPGPQSSSTTWPAPTPRRPRGIEIRGRAETVTEPHALIRIHPDRVIAWGLDE
jgi:pyridoxamine 5'-phosphate oxidase family protein